MKHIPQVSDLNCSTSAPKATRPATRKQYLVQVKIGAVPGHIRGEHSTVEISRRKEGL